MVPPTSMRAHRVDAAPPVPRKRARNVPRGVFQNSHPCHQLRVRGQSLPQRFKLHRRQILAQRVRDQKNLRRGDIHPQPATKRTPGAAHQRSASLLSPGQVELIIRPKRPPQRRMKIPRRFRAGKVVGESGDGRGIQRQKVRCAYFIAAQTRCTSSWSSSTCRNSPVSARCSSLSSGKLLAM